MKKSILFGGIMLITMALTNSCTQKQYNLFGGIYGIVSDSDTGEPIENASIVLAPGGKTKTTGTDGRFEFNELDPTQYSIQVQKTGYKTDKKAVTVVSGEQTPANISLTKNN
jgi:hypothetical protein